MTALLGILPVVEQASWYLFRDKGAAGVGTDKNIVFAVVGNERTHSGHPPRSPKSIGGRDAQARVSE
ncbi:unnamed protein product [Prunus armeniaca]|uniref:Uncharacterized protein n=1 Tax=Prunus armeniaca TaxID=36596 RepID=A0A6J5WZS5_PRUAR|nr:unnamed protein product [Prunus armeniaca]